MPTHAQYYITCSHCGEVAKEHGETLFGETDDCVRAEAIDLGWKSNAENQFIMEDRCQDFCPQCVKQGRHLASIGEGK